MFRYTKVCKGLMVAFGGSALLAAASATAQPTHRVEITGSNIKRVDSEGPQPIVTIKREDIERSGKSTVNELLSSLPVISGGSFSENTSSGNSFAPGTAAVSHQAFADLCVTKHACSRNVVVDVALSVLIRSHRLTSTFAHIFL